MSRTRLVDLLDHTNSLFRLADAINWQYLEDSLGKTFEVGPGRPLTSTRLIIGLHLLKYLENKSDEEIVRGFVLNPYWQYFCGCEFFEHKIPIHPTTMVKWRKKIGVDKFEKLLEETLNIAKRERLIDNFEFRRVIVDTTVQEKSITFPTDSKLFHKARKKLVQYAFKREIQLRQTYERLGKRSFIMQARYAHARQMKRARTQSKKLKVYLGRVVRDIERKCLIPDAQLKNLLHLSKRLLQQQKYDSNKLYSLHAPEVECIAKGKIHKKYEFGCKVSIVTTAKKNWIIGIDAHHGNPYDGHTLSPSIDQVKRITGHNPEQAFVDLGYKGEKNHPRDVEVFVGKPKRKITPTLIKYIKRRSSIEPIIGHAKSDHRLGRNFLMGKMGDRINAFLSGCAFNLKKIMNSFESQKISVGIACC